jgi:flagellar basal body-associated protein FliL
METQSEQNLETKIVQPKKKIFLIILISGIIVIVVVAVVLGVILGTKKKENNNNNNYSKVNIVNSYDNTDELIQKFPVGNPTLC